MKGLKVLGWMLNGAVWFIATLYLIGCGLNIVEIKPNK